MNPRALCALAARLMRHPAAPYHEHAISAEVKQICHEHDLACKEDSFGNLLVSWERRRLAGEGRPIVFAAHMDHPGFEVLPASKTRGLRIRFRGGVPDDYFREGIPIRLMPTGQPAKLSRRIGKDRTFEVRARQALEAKPAFAVWDLDAFAIRKNHIHGR